MSWYEAWRDACTSHKILSPQEILSAFARWRDEPRVRWQRLGDDGQGHTIEAMVLDPGHAQRDVLCYGCPDPGEVVGASALIPLVEAWLAGAPWAALPEVRWHLIPCLNMADQPDGGHSLATIQKATLPVREVDWCVDDPRPETRALLVCLEATRFDVVFPLHDEFHGREVGPCYIMLSESIPDAWRDAMIQALLCDGQQLDTPPTLIMAEVAPDMETSTFHAMSQQGALVVIPEVSWRPELDDAALLRAGMGACLRLLHERLHPTRTLDDQP